MNLPRPGPKTAALAVSLVFVLASGYSLLKLFEYFDAHNRQPLDRLWVLSQAEFEYQRLLNTVDRYALDDDEVGQDQLGLRLDILWSRLNVMNKGRFAEALAEVDGVPAILDGVQRELAQLEPRIRALSPEADADYRTLREQIQAIGLTLHEVVVRGMHADELDFLRQFQAHRQNYWQLVVSVLGMLAGGAMFILVLFAERNRTHRYAQQAHELSRQLSHQAAHDALTGLVNRREFERRLGRVLETARRDGSEHVLCYLDLDQFKVINDTCGHMAGDELLRQLASLLVRRVRHRDTLARLGGDEFGILLEHCDREQGIGVAEVLLQVINDFRFLWEGRTFRLGASIGLVPITATSGTLAEILSAADSACYAAKDRGRNRLNVYHPQDLELARRQGEMQWAARINNALEEDRLRLSYQVIRPLTADGGLHYELLLRLEDEQGRLVPPGVFLPAAERYNLSPTLDRWVLKRALNWLRDHPDHLKRLELCSINLSGLTLGDEGFLNFAIEQLAASRVPPERLCFEITETAAIARLADAMDLIQGLRNLGCSFALDDFGSGLSSFGYLKNLPVDYLKIDGLFIRDILDDPIDLALVRSINDIGHLMGKRTVAEFVESDAIAQQLRGIGVDYLQGYAIGRPLPLEDMAVEQSASGRLANP